MVDLTHRRLLKIAVPIVLANATVPILGIVDTAAVGQLGEAAPIGAVGIGAIILSSVYWIFGFLRMGTTGLTSQASGAGDVDEVQSSRAQTIRARPCSRVPTVLPQHWQAISKMHRESAKLVRQ